MRDGQHVGEILVGAHHAEARKVDGGPGHFRQRLLGVDLRAALGEDRLEFLQGIVVFALCIRLLRRERGRLSPRRLQGSQVADARRGEAHRQQPYGEPCREALPGRCGGECRCVHGLASQFRSRGERRAIILMLRAPPMLAIIRCGVARLS